MNKFKLCIVVAALAMQAGVVSAETVIPPSKESGVAEPIQKKGEVNDELAQKGNCISQTGSRIEPKNEGGCNGQPGRAYSHEEIERTGASTLAGALQRLDPAIQTHR